MKLFKIFFCLIIIFIGLSFVVKARAQGTTSFSKGWNYLVLSNDWYSKLAFDSLPDKCPYVVYKNDSWFNSFVRGYSKPENFVVGRQYFVFCKEAVDW